MGEKQTFKRDNRDLPFQEEVAQIVEGLLVGDMGDVIIEGDGEPVFDFTWEDIASPSGLTISQVRHAFRRGSERLIMRLYIVDEVEHLERIGGIKSPEAIDEMVSERLAHILENFGFEHLMEIVANRRI